MKKIIPLLFLFLLSIKGNAQNPIPNGDFENWNTVNYDDPQFYFTSNSNDVRKQLPVNVMKTTDAWHGSFAVQLNTVSANNDTVYAFVANGDPTNPVGQGIPYNQKPTGIRGYYKCNVMPGDTALIVSFFKLGGVTIGAYINKITGTQNSYSLFNFSFAPALPATPDTVIFAMVSGNAFGGGKGIPGSMLQIDSISFTGVASQPVGFNGDFETWQTNSTDILANWSTSDAGALKTVDFNSGTTALELQTNTNNNNNTNAATATTGISIPSGTIGGNPFSNTVDTLCFYYKFTNANVNDSAKVNLEFKIPGNSPIFINYLLPPSATYLYVEFPISLGMTPDSVIVFLSSSKVNNPPANFTGADFKIDDLHFKSLQTPVANFSFPLNNCTATPISMTDFSSNSPSVWTWSMPGATPPTSSTQNPFITYAAPGSYTITMSSSNAAGQSNVVTKTINVLASPTVTVTSQTVCLNQPVTLSANGATSYVWSNGSHAPAVIYTPSVSETFTVTGSITNGCSDTAVSTVVVLPLPVVGVAQGTKQTICANDPVTLNGTGAQNYSWTGGISDGVSFSVTTTTNYTVTGTDANGCSSTAKDTVNVNSLPNVGTMMNPPFPICAGGTVTLNGTNAMSYSWSNGITDGVAFVPAPSTTYSVTGTDGNGCSKTTTVTVTVNPLPNVGINSSTGDTICSGDLVVLNGTGAQNYSWSGGVADGVGFVPSSTNTYTVTGTDVNGCSATDTASINVTVCTGMKNNLSINNKIIMMPNPMSSAATIQFPTVERQSELLVFDVAGRQVKAQIIPEGTSTANFDRQGLDNGVYFFNLFSGKNIIAKGKVIIE